MQIELKIQAATASVIVLYIFARVLLKYKPNELKSR